MPATGRTRVAPSPTRDPHVGTAYVALPNYCFAKHHDGAFVLRIEDTDRNRSTAASEAVILGALRSLGPAWDEGPDVGGPYGPYRQSDRLEIYERYARMLLDGGHAFRCFCSKERLTTLPAEQRARGVPTAYDGRCLELTQAEVAANESAGIPFVVRLRVPHEGIARVDDLLRGPIEFEWSSVDMQVLVKSDGWPTYHLANVVDDDLIAITHVMRGEEWLPSALKHLLLYEAFGWQMPQLVHLPLLRNPDKSKLSKRKNPTSIRFYERMGYLPAALANFLGLFAIPPPGGEELMDLATMVEAFHARSHLARRSGLRRRKARLAQRPLHSETARRCGTRRAGARLGLNPTYLGAIAPFAHKRTTHLLARATSAGPFQRATPRPPPVCAEALWRASPGTARLQSSVGRRSSF